MSTTDQRGEAPAHRRHLGTMATPPRSQATSWDEWLQAESTAWEAAGRRRQLRPLEIRSPVRARLNGREVVLFCSNDYLGLSDHPAVRHAAAEAAQTWGMGPRGAALICGYTEQHEALESELASLKGMPAALLFPTGYAANTAVMSTLAGSGVEIFSDELNHASIIDGCRLACRSGAKLQVYGHGDVEHLDSLLEASTAPRRLIVTDTVFSMDGDLAPLPQLVELKRRHGALLVVDEAHATLVLGRHGGGVAELHGVAASVDVHVGTLSKAIGTQGGFVACSRELREFLLNRGRPYVFSTALPVPSVAAARAALTVRRQEPELVKRMTRHLQALNRAWDMSSATPILPILVGDGSAALAMAQGLLTEGLYAPAIRPPTVPEGTARVRVTVSAAHRDDEVQHLAETVRRLRLRPRGEASQPSAPPD